ncbi:hypothetical protein BC827DRAFT_194635 [Russula dissimulans]|nr:hypothetical protein BC827DRAFT_194635 [Russula dissimulans]
MGDTLASELGILFSTSPILFTTLQIVSLGTNSALSFLGMTDSIGGGMAMNWTISHFCLLDGVQSLAGWLLR